MRGPIRTIVSVFVVLLMMMVSVASVIAYDASDGAFHDFADPRFETRWARTDLPVAEGVVARTWMWGPSPYTEGLMETYLGEHGDTRLVQYFDKSRMELVDLDAEDTGLWVVTQGLLALEMMRGELQVGDAFHLPHSQGPAQENVAGDPGPNNGPTYATMGVLIEAEARSEGTVITERLALDGTITTDASLSAYGVTAGERVTEDWVDHTIASVFWDFMTSQGLIWDGAGYSTAALVEDPFYAVGLPVTEAYWTRVRVLTTEKDVLVQCFERRCLTYTPDNPAGWQVEAGNIGQHYYRWRQMHEWAIPAQSVPTKAVVGPDGALYVGTLPGFPFEPGSASVWRVDGDGNLTLYASGLNAVVDLDFDADGNLYVLEMVEGGLLELEFEGFEGEDDPPPPGRVIRIGADGSQIVVASGFVIPTAMAIDDDGWVYVANFGIFGFTAEIVRFHLDDPDSRETVAEGLSNPRSLRFGPDNMLYIAEAGHGGDLCTEMPWGETLCTGPSGRVVRVPAAGGADIEVVVALMPSLATEEGMFATGPHDIAFGDDGTIYVVIGEGGDPANPAVGAPFLEGFSVLLVIPADETGPIVLADINAFEREHNPDQGIDLFTGEPEVISNPYSVVLLADGSLAVIDSGGNSLLRVTTAGDISVLAIFPERWAPAPPFFNLR